MNSVNLIGTCVRPAERIQHGGKLVMSRMGLRVTKRWYNSEGPREERNYVTLLLYEQQARFAEQYVKEGHIVSVRGELISRSASESYLEQLVRVQEINLLQGKSKASTRVPAHYSIILVAGIESEEE